MLRRAGAVLEGHFKLTSGRHSGTYFEKFQVLQYPAYTQRLCGLIADHFRNSGVELVAGPTTGGVILSFEVARQLGVRGIFAETAGSERRLLRGFRVNAGERVLVVDDVLTTGGSIRQVIDAVRQAGGEPVGVAVLVDRTGGKADFGLPFFACLELVVPSYDSSDCPLCSDGLPLTET
ncbi:MAG: orotate phosphoribosyltransferase [Dehalococcoidia bacterium]|jgi:orotate phosphoribosyltransferase